jgi:hypothetical protein
LQFAQANAQTKNCKRACFANADKIVFKNFPTLQKKNKITPTHNPTNTADNDRETQY